MSDYPPPPPPPPPPSQPGEYGPPPAALADWATRVGAALIDGVLTLAIVIVGVILAAIIGTVSSALGFLVSVVIYLVAAALGFYFMYMNGACGQSPGKKVLGIKVVSEETGQVIGGGLGIVRGLAHIVDSLICYIGYLFPLWDAKRQTLADKIMRTLVLSNLPKQTVSADLLKIQ